jgi:flagellar protein FliO/FliZ
MAMLVKVFGLLTLQLVLVASALAETAPKFAAPSASVAAQDMNAGTGVLQIFGSLALVVATILVIGWIARRLRTIPHGRGGRLKVVDEVTIGPKERAVILQVDGMHLVLGVGEGRVSLLHRAPALADRADAPESARIETGNRPFIDVLKRSLGK